MTRVVQTSRVGRAFGIVVVSSVGVLLASCAGQQSAQDPQQRRGFSPSEFGVPASRRVVEPGQPIPRGGGVFQVGRPYTIRGRTYVPRHEPTYDNRGQASWYGDDFHGRRTANGEIYDMYALSAAHRTLPLPSYVRVTNPANGRSLVVRVNDRGPYHGNRIIDLSKRAAMVLDLRRSGVGNVRVQYVGRAPLDGNDDAWLVTTVRNNGAPMPASQVAAIAPVPDWAQNPPVRGQGGATAVASREPLPSVDQSQAVRAALRDSLVPVPPDRPRDQALQVATLGLAPTATIEPETRAEAQPGPIAQPLFAALGLEPARRALEAEPQPAPAAAPVALVPLPPQHPSRPPVLSAFAPVQTASAAGAPVRAAPVGPVQILNVGTYRDAAQARRFADGLSRHGGAVVEPVTIGGLTFHQVRVGPFNDPARARAALSDAQALGASGARLTGG